MKATMGVKDLKLGIITQALPIVKVETQVSKYIKMMAPISSEIYLITSNYPADSIINKKIHVENISTDDMLQSIWIRAIKYMFMQIQMSIKLAELSKNIDILIFFVGGTALILPMVTAKILGKKVVLESTGSGYDSAKAIYSERVLGLGGIIFPFIIKIMENINYHLADRVIVNSCRLADQHKLESHKTKIRVACNNFIDFKKFKITRNHAERPNLIGYIGRLSEEKGIMNFVEAIPKLLKDNDTFEIIIIGGGTMDKKVSLFLGEKKLQNSVKCLGWLPNDCLPNYLNKMKLLVVPSYTDVLPATMLEAMACGVPILATPVGSIPDYIKNNETGFIMDNNSPDCIAINIKHILRVPHLDAIIKNARALVEQEFAYATAVDKYRDILKELV